MNIMYFLPQFEEQITNKQATFKLLVHSSQLR